MYAYHIVKIAGREKVKMRYDFSSPRSRRGIPQVSTRFSLSMEMNRLTRDGTPEPVSRDQILRHERGQGNVHFSCSADHVQDWQPYPVDRYSCYVCVTIQVHMLYVFTLCGYHQ